MCKLDITPLRNDPYKLSNNLVFTNNANPIFNEFMYYVNNL